SVRRRSSFEGTARAPVAWAAGRGNQGWQWEACVLPDTGHPRATYSKREGDFEHLYESSSNRSDGHGVHGGLRQAGPARTGGTEPGEIALPWRAIVAAFQRSVFQ